MAVYGLYARDIDAGDLVWFTALEPLQPGAYVLGHQHGPSPNVYVAESIPALILQVGPLIQHAENCAQSALSTADMPASTERRIANDMTDGLIKQLTETSSIWVADPHWVRDLSPLP